MVFLVIMGCITCKFENVISKVYKVEDSDNTMKASIVVRLGNKVLILGGG